MFLDMIGHKLQPCRSLVIVMVRSVVIFFVIFQLQNIAKLTMVWEIVVPYVCQPPLEEHVPAEREWPLEMTARHVLMVSGN